MTDLGLTMVWLAVQVAILLSPALALNALASRRGPATGAWVAVLSLGLVVVLNVMAFAPRIGWNDKMLAPKIALPAIAFQKNPAPNIEPNSLVPDVTPMHAKRVRALDWLGLAWDRLGRGASEPAVRARPWGSTLAAVALAGMAAGLLRLTIGFWAVILCCRRGRPVADPGMTGLLEELQCAMACRRPVALREVPDLTTPATAGRRRPVLLLPDDWRSWTDAERRAVLAHELAHIIRGDYATGLLARLAVVLNYYHPLVRWMAGRLQLQQEQAADAMGAQFAGGRVRYLVALSSLALRQDGRSPCWPAKAFLPARGTLIRRIAMLRNESDTNPSHRPLSMIRRMLTLFGLLGLTLGVATLRGPAHGADDDSPPAAKVEVPAAERRDSSGSFVAPFVREGEDGVVLIRPAAAFRHKGLGPLFEFYRAALDDDAAMAIKQLNIDTSRQGFLNLRLEDIEWVTAGIGFGRAVTPKAPSATRGAPAGGADGPLHSIQFGRVAARIVAPFDWRAFLRQWRVESEEAHVKGRTYYKLTGEFTKILGPNPCIFLPDDRTIVFHMEDVIRRIAGGDDPAPSAYLRGKEWERACRGLLAIAINNQTDAFAKHYDLGRPDDAVVVSQFTGINQWIVSADDADPIVLHADASCRNRDASEAISRSLDSLMKLDPTKSPDAAAHPKIARMLKALAANVRVVHTDTAITVQAQNFGSLADFGEIVVSEEQEPKAGVAARNDAKHSVKK